MPAPRRLTAKLFFTVGLALAVLVGLGAWQLARLQWKQDLIAMRERALTGEPVSLRDIEAGIEHGFDVDVLRTTAAGYYRHDLERYVYHLRDGQVGWRVITPFVVPDNYVILVDRGYVPDAYRDPATRPESVAIAPMTAALKATPRTAWPAPVTISGFIRNYPVKGDFFTPDNDPKANTWYSYDLPGMMQTFPDELGAIPPDSVSFTIPVFLQLGPGGEPGNAGMPIIDPLETKLKNNHLQYAITWFSLALVLLVISVIYVRKGETA